MLFNLKDKSLFVIKLKKIRNYKNYTANGHVSNFVSLMSHQNP